MNAFMRGVWCVKYREHGEQEWCTLKGEAYYWYADPLLFTWKEKTYLFTEAFDERSQIGKLAVSVYENKCFSTPEIIIKKPYHLSYPCVFGHNGKVYMIPETSQNWTLELYQADQDLMHWKKCGNLIEGIRLVDSTIVQNNDELLLYSYSDFGGVFKSYIYKINLTEIKAEKIKEQEYPLNRQRPAGNIFLHNGECYFPTQNNVSLYGEQTIIQKLGRLDSNFLGKEVLTITPDNLRLQEGIENNINRTHTISYNEHLEVIDVLYEKRDIITLPKVYIRKARNICFKILRHI